MVVVAVVVVVLVVVVVVVVLAMRLSVCVRRKTMTKWVRLAVRFSGSRNFY